VGLWLVLVALAVMLMLMLMLKLVMKMKMKMTLVSWLRQRTVGNRPTYTSILPMQAKASQVHRMAVQCSGCRPHLARPARAAEGRLLHSHQAEHYGASSMDKWSTSTTIEQMVGGGGQSPVPVARRPRVRHHPPGCLLLPLRSITRQPRRGAQQLTL